MCLLEPMTVAKETEYANKLKPSGAPKSMGYSGGGHPIKLWVPLGRRKGNGRGGI